MEYGRKGMVYSGAELERAKNRLGSALSLFNNNFTGAF